MTTKQEKIEDDDATKSAAAGIETGRKKTEQTVNKNLETQDAASDSPETTIQNLQAQSSLPAAAPQETIAMAGVADDRLAPAAEDIAITQAIATLEEAQDHAARLFHDEMKIRKERAEEQAEIDKQAEPVPPVFVPGPNYNEEAAAIIQALYDKYSGQESGFWVAKTILQYAHDNAGLAWVRIRDTPVTPPPEEEVSDKKRKVG